MGVCQRLFDADLRDPRIYNSFSRFGAPSPSEILREMNVVQASVSIYI